MIPLNETPRCRVSRQQRLFLNGTPEAHRALSLLPHLADPFDAVQLTPRRDDATFASSLKSLASTPQAN